MEELTAVITLLNKHINEGTNVAFADLVDLRDRLVEAAGPVVIEPPVTVPAITTVPEEPEAA